MARPGCDLKHARFVAVTPAATAQVRRNPEALARLLEENREETGLGVFWHGVQYLLAGRAKGVRGPFAWLTSGGETLGRTPGGPVRYLAPEQVRELAAALAGEPPDELGDGVYDEAAMDAAGVYPGTWARDGRNTDLLGTMRELYSYLRDFLAKQRRARKGVLVVLTLEPGPDDAEDEAGVEEEPAPAAAVPVAPPTDAAGLVLAGAGGRRYERARGTPPKALDAALASLGYQPLGDLAILPLLEGCVVRAYRSADGTVTAAAVLREGKVASTTFLCPLAQDALVVASDAFVLEKTKRRLFATMRSGATPAELDAALRERRRAVEKKHGAAVPSPPTLESAAAAWEAWSVKQAGTW